MAGAGRGTAPRPPAAILAASLRAAPLAVYAPLVVLLAVAPVALLPGPDGAFVAPLALAYVAGAGRVAARRG